jgi:hypothetical protein
MTSMRLRLTLLSHLFDCLLVLLLLLCATQDQYEIEADEASQAYPGVSYAQQVCTNGSADCMHGCHVALHQHGQLLVNETAAAAAFFNLLQIALHTPAISPAVLPC